MQYAIFTISPFQVSGSLEIEKNQNKVYILTVLFVVFFYSSPNSLKRTSPSSHLPDPSICPSLSSFCWLMARWPKQTRVDGPSARPDEPCHEPRSDITLTLRPTSNHLSPACCAQPLDSSLRHTFAIPSRTVFCQH